MVFSWCNTEWLSVILNGQTDIFRKNFWHFPNKRHAQNSEFQKEPKYVGVQNGLVWPNDATRCSGWGAVKQFSMRMSRPTGGLCQAILCRRESSNHPPSFSTSLLIIHLELIYSVSENKRNNQKETIFSETRIGRITGVYYILEDAVASWKLPCPTFLGFARFFSSCHCLLGWMNPARFHKATCPPYLSRSEP